MRDTAVTQGHDRRALWFDIAVAALALAISFSIFVSFARHQDLAGAALVGTLLLVHSGALALRRRAPAVVLGVTVVSGLAVLATGWPTVVLGLALVVAVYTAGAELPRGSSIAGLGSALVALAISGLIAHDGPDASTQIANGGVLAVAWFIGASMRSRREYAADLEERNRELEEARDELATKAVAEERVRIARELHDVIAHNMSVIAVQAGAGRRIIDRDPAEAKHSLGIIEDTSRSALAETRRVLGLLREQEDSGSLSPAPSLDELEALVSGVNGAGLDVELQRTGALDDLGPGLQLTIYRIVQEALTNVIKHSAARKGRVAISRVDGTVHVEVVDDGRGSGSSTTPGSGLRGMRERVDAYGGRLEAGDLPEGGFRVTASLPVGPE